MNGSECNMLANSINLGFSPSKFKRYYASVDFENLLVIIQDKKRNKTIVLSDDLDNTIKYQK